MNISELTDKYSILRSTLEKIESGDWQNDPDIRSLSLEQVENMKYLLDAMKDMGFDILEKFRKVN